MRKLRPGEVSQLDAAEPEFKLSLSSLHCTELTQEDPHTTCKPAGAGLEPGPQFPQPPPEG